jgi:hypothetical protein
MPIDFTNATRGFEPPPTADACSMLINSAHPLAGCFPSAIVPSTTLSPLDNNAPRRARPSSTENLEVYRPSGPATGPWPRQMLAHAPTCSAVSSVCSAHLRVATWLPAITQYRSGCVLSRMNRANYTSTREGGLF